MEDKKWLKSIRSEEGNYIAGFVDGEGSFNVSLRKRDDHKIGWQIAPSFNISQRDRVILSWIKNILRCGTLRERKDGVIYYEVRNVKMLKEIVIPFFQRFGFRSSAKKKNFSIFKQIVYLLDSNKSIDESILEQIASLREKLNEGRGRTRKYGYKDMFPLSKN